MITLDTIYLSIYLSIYLFQNTFSALSKQLKCTPIIYLSFFLSIYLSLNILIAKLFTINSYS